MIILGIETSCDDTAAAVVKDGKDIISNIISSQHVFHTKYGGIVPEIASRKHQENIIPVIQEALLQARMTLHDIQGIAVTRGPGLIGSLLVGINVAKAIAYSQKLPLVGINHLEGHLLAPFLEHEIPFPNITLVVSGGHTNLYHVGSFDVYKSLGKTRDDAAGEAYDKVAKLLGLGYPGGITLDRLAQTGNPSAIAFPRPMLHDKSFDFSFSGLKTAVLYHVKNNCPGAVPESAMPDIAASFQAAVVEILVEKTLRAARHYQVSAITLAGGVAANSLLRSKMHERAAEENIAVFLPSPVLCTDNAAMIARAGEHRIASIKEFPFGMNAVSRWPIA
ncbi:MAG: tRNA (adenosine(37)-N6)-threonylcarbamoyltransferase complex transferase subunit TsaD [Pseudomonadota bacterium]